MQMTWKMLAAGVATGALALSAAAVSAQPPAGAKPADSKPADKQPEKPKADKPKAESKSTAKIGETAPDFTLTDTEGKSHHLADLKGKIVVLEWFNPACPVSAGHHSDKNTFNPLYDAYNGKDVVFLAINSGADGKEGAGKDASAKGIKDFGMKYPVLLDTDGKVGHTYGAKTTPHMYVIAADGTLAYMGAIDNQKPAKDAAHINYVKQAIDELKAGKKVSVAETRAYGCGVKY